MATTISLRQVSEEQQPSYLQRKIEGVTVKRSAILNEVSGALGDLGTFIPIVISLALFNGLDLGTTLIFTGFYNVVTGFLFGVPMPVQPMKSIAAAAINPSHPFNVPEIMAAGLSVSFILVFLGITGLMTFVQWLVPLPVVRGIQLAQGLNFSLTAVKYILNKQNFSGKGKKGGKRPWEGVDGRILAVAAFCLVILVSGVGAVGGASKSKEEKKSVEMEEGEKESRPKTWRERVVKKWKELDAMLFVQPGEDVGASRTGLVVPSAVIIFVVGVILAFARKPSIWNSLSVGPATPKIVHITRHEWREGFVRGAIPQLPLSLLNSVVAVVRLSNDLFPDRLDVNPMHVATSVGLMNVVGCWFGCMPVCHGCGGLAGQYRFGGRSGLAPALLGAGKIVLGLLLGSSLIKVLAQFPVALLGVLLLFAGLELAMAARDQNTRADSFIVLVVTAVALQWGNATWGFLSGMAVAWIFKLRTLRLPFLHKPLSAPPLTLSHA